MYSFFVLYSLGLCERLEQKMRKVINRSHTPLPGMEEILQVHGLPQLAQTRRIPWTPKGTHPWPWDDGKFFNLNSWKTLLGPNPQNGVIRKFPAMTPPFPRDSRPAACHATACVPPSCHEARPPWGETRDGDLPPPFPGGVESGIRPFSKGHSCGGEMCCFYQKKRRFKTSDTMNGRGNQKATRNIK